MAAEQTVLDQLVASSSLHWSDYVVLVLYFVIVIGVGIWSSCLNRGSVGGYFLAGRNMHWILVGASLFASNIGSGHFIGLAGTAAASGLAVGVFEISAVYTLQLLGWVFVPVYVAAGVYTMPEYLKKRFGGQRIRIYLAVLSVLLYIFTKISADLFAGAVFIQQSIGWDIWGSIIALLVLAMIFTIAGGLSAVIWTDFVQVIIMVIGAAVLMVLGFIRIGGYDMLEPSFLSSTAWPNFTKSYEEALSNGLNVTADQVKYADCGKTPADSFHLMRPASDMNLPWTGLVFGLATVSVWYWCSDQVIVQRALAAKNMSHVKAGVIFAALLKILPLFLMVMPGMISRILYPDLVGCAEPSACEQICGNRAGCSNIAYPVLVVKLMPHGARGMMLAVMMSALMSSLTSIFNSSSTIFTMDIWRRIRSQATDVELMIVGRVFIVAVVAISVAWLPIINNVSELFHYIQAVQSFLSPPVCAVFVLAIAWKRVNEQGAFWGLMVGLFTGLIRFIWEYSYGPAPPCGEPDTRHPLITHVHYLHFGIILFFITLIATIVISYLTKPIDDKYLVRLTFASRFEQGERVDINETTYLNTENLPMQRMDSEDEEDKNRDETPIVTKRPVAWYMTGLYWICGIEKMNTNQAESQAGMSDEHLSIDEDPTWRSVTNTCSILIMIGNAFLWGYFS